MDFDIGKLEHILLRHKPAPESLISILEDVQDHFRFLPEEALVLIGNRIGVPASQVYGVATFYNAFSLIPKGKHLVSVCQGTACHVRGGGAILDKIRQKLNLDSRETTEDLQFTVEEVRCLGCCSLSPVMRVDNDTYAHMTQAQVPVILEKYQLEEEALSE